MTDKTAKTKKVKKIKNSIVRAEGFGGKNSWHEKLRADPEFKKRHFAMMHERRDAALAERKQAAVEGRAMLPRLVAEKELAKLEAGNYTPSPETIASVRDLMERGYKLDKIRKEMRGLTQKQWDSFTKALFKNHYNQVEELGIDLISAKKEALKDAKASLREVKKEIKQEKTWIRDQKVRDAEEGKFIKRTVGVNLLQLKHQLETKKYNVELELADILQRIGAVGDKSSVTAIHFHSNIDRTKRPPVEEALDVTPESE